MAEAKISNNCFVMEVECYVYNIFSWCAFIYKPLQLHYEEIGHKKCFDSYSEAHLGYVGFTSVYLYVM